MTLDGAYFAQLIGLVIAIACAVKGIRAPGLLRSAPALCVLGLVILFGVPVALPLLIDTFAGTGGPAETGLSVIRFGAPAVAYLCLALGLGSLSWAASRAGRTEQVLRAHARALERLGEAERLVDGFMRSNIGGAFLLRAVRDRYDGIDHLAFQHCNNAFEHLIGAHRSRVTGRSPEQVMPGDLGRWIHANARATIETGLPVHLEQDFHTPGGPRWFELALAGAGQYVTGTIVDITTRKAAELARWKDAHTDPLTGLANRKLLVQRLESEFVRMRGAPDSRTFCVLFFDFDRFKAVNDTLGHDAGDQLLRNIADRLRGVVAELPGAPDAHLIARLGGDEFVVMLRDIGGRERIEQIAGRMLDVLNRAHDLSGHEAVSTASIGVAIARSGHRGPDEILAEADGAMYAAKRAGKARVVFAEQPGHPAPRLAQRVRGQDRSRSAA